MKYNPGKRTLEPEIFIKPGTAYVRYDKPPEWSLFIDMRTQEPAYWLNNNTGENKIYTEGENPNKDLGYES